MQKFIIKSNLKDIACFAKMIPVRAAKFRTAPSTPLPTSYAVNETAKLLHPRVQKLRVKSIEEISQDVKSYVLEAAEKKAPAYFRAGQYISLKLKIGDSVLTRPYSIASPPADALKGTYTITVKRVSDGFASGYILDNFTVGTEVTASAPEGTFYYEPLRDAPAVVCLAGGSGITPFLSLAGAVADGTEDCELIIIYGCRTENDILHKDKLDTLSAKCPKIKVVYVLSDSCAEGCEQGFITAELIKKYAPAVYSVFVCGPAAMYAFEKEELKKLNLPEKYIRFETQSGEAPATGETKTFECSVYARDIKKRVIPCRNDESILTALERAGIETQSMCRGGECGFCRSKLISGEVFVPEENDGRRIADLKFGYIHPCRTYPQGNIEIRI